MILRCFDTIIIPRKIIFDNTNSTGILPDVLKRANVVAIDEKEGKQILKSIRLFPSCQGCLFKLKQNGIDGILHCANSEWKCIESGVPQGSVQCPLYF